MLCLYRETFLDNNCFKFDIQVTYNPIYVYENRGYSKINLDSYSALLTLILYAGVLRKTNICHVPRAGDRLSAARKQIISSVNLKAKFEPHSENVFSSRGSPWLALHFFI